MIDRRLHAAGDPVIENEGDEAIRVVVERLSRPHRSGGRVIERAAILADALDADQILAWIAEHGGHPEDLAPLASSRGLHSSRLTDSTSAARRTPLRYMLPQGALR
jgi:hypothetical protein